MPKFEPDRFLKAIQDYKITQAPVVPPIIVFLTKHPMVEQYDLSSLRSILSGAAPLDAHLQAAVAERLRCACRQGYGMTELSPIVSFSPRDPDAIVLGSCGKLAANTTVKIVDSLTREALPVGSEGELCVKGPQVMQGYLNRPDATAESIDADGFLITGDLARIDETGTLFIGDRVKELIKVKGFQVAPAELEGLLLKHTDVADVCVIGVPDERHGQLPCAYVVPRNEAHLDAEILLDFLKPHVAEFKLPQTFRFVDSVPKSASGKLLRRAIAELEAKRGSEAEGIKQE